MSLQISAKKNLWNGLLTMIAAFPEDSGAGPKAKNSRRAGKDNPRNIRTEVLLKTSHKNGFSKV